MRDLPPGQDDAPPADCAATDGTAGGTLSTAQKEFFLRRAGAIVPSFPQRRASRPNWFRRGKAKPLPRPDVAHEQAVREWKRSIDRLFATWLAAQR